MAPFNSKKIANVFSVRFLRRIFNSLYARVTGRVNYSSEIYFWETNLAKKDEFKNSLIVLLDPKRRKELFPAKLIPYIYDLKKKNNNLKLLEIGSGPISRLAWGVEEGLFQITAIDPLAKLYSKLMRKHKYDYPIKPIACLGEDISKIFSEESFDIIYSRNALDHVVSPRKCLEGMCYVLKRGGIIFLEGFIRGGTRQKWRGLHKHDLVPENGHLLHYDKKGFLTNLTKDLDLKCICLLKSQAGDGEEYIIIFEKN